MFNLQGIFQFSDKNDKEMFCVKDRKSRDHLRIIGIPEEAGTEPQGKKGKIQQLRKFKNYPISYFFRYLLETKTRTPEQDLDQTISQN